MSVVAGLGLLTFGAFIGAFIMAYRKNRECSLYLEAVNRSWDREHSQTLRDMKALEGSKRLVVYSRDA